VIFKEGETHFTRQPNPTRFSEDDDLFGTTQVNVDPKSTISNDIQNSNISNTQGMAPRPSNLNELHSNDEINNPQNIDQNTPLDPNDAPLALWRTCQEPRPSTRLKKSLEYLS